MNSSSVSESSLTESISVKSTEEVLRLQLSDLPYSTMVTLRYLFAFLYSLTRLSDENLMDSYNLAIVWGPTLIRPEEDDLVALQTPITQLVQYLIVNHIQVFPQDSGSLFFDTTTRERPRTLSLSQDTSGSMTSLTEWSELDMSSPVRSQSQIVDNNNVVIMTADLTRFSSPGSKLSNDGKFSPSSPQFENGFSSILTPNSDSNSSSVSSGASKSSSGDETNISPC